MTAASSIEVLNAYNDAWKRGDLEAGANFYAEDIVVHMGGLGPLSRDYRGRDDFLENWVQRVEEYTDSWDVEGQEVLISGGDGVSISVNVHWTRGDRKITARRICDARAASPRAMARCIAALRLSHSTRKVAAAWTVSSPSYRCRVRSASCA